ncbi:MAG: fibrobacter succinogenes major paralogous domain-containing protein, partial [Candidatus Tenebribacter burtonii]|nr:fibrobacter succinogenes major paralogous domain-containing protein [Candidatus Tenebribacter burtonii]
LVSTDLTISSFVPETLLEETMYYWYVEATDPDENSTLGPLWSFTTSTGGTGTVTDIDGNVYQTIMIGAQEWIMENLKVTHYRNGDAIPHITGNGVWISTNSGAYCVYDDDPSNAETYGNLYNWYAVDDPRGIAPEGWHVPTDEEIMELEMYLGMSASQASSTGWRGTNEGSKLAGNADLWNDGALEENSEFGSSGFSLLPGGNRTSLNGAFTNLSFYGNFWSSTEDNSNAWFRGLTYNYTTDYRYYISKRYGVPVRCVRD